VTRVFVGNFDGKAGAPSFEVAAVTLLGTRGAVVVVAGSSGSALVPLAVVGLIVEALFSAGLVASVVEAPNCFLRADACALAPNAGGTILLVPVGAAGYLISSSFFKAGLAGTILVGPAVAGPVVAV
jgi:predicted small integral membrane protein